MSVRHRARRRAIQILFSLEFNAMEVPGVLARFWKEHPTPQVQRIFADELVGAVREHVDAIDRILESCASNWEIGRMASVDLSVLRLATLELVFRKDIPAAVSIDEAVQLAREFGSEQSSRFVNGVLDRVRMEHRDEAE